MIYSREIIVRVTGHVMWITAGRAARRPTMTANNQNGREMNVDERGCIPPVSPKLKWRKPHITNIGGARRAGVKGEFFAEVGPSPTLGASPTS
jgi:hypothetical protein